MTMQSQTQRMTDHISSWPSPNRASPTAHDWPPGARKGMAGRIWLKQTNRPGP